MRKLPALAIGCLLAVSCGSGSHSPNDEEGGEGAGKISQTAGFENINSENRADTQWKTEMRDYFAKGKYDLAFNDSNYIQYAAAERVGVDPIYTLADAYYARRPLVKVKSGDNYEVEKLTHSLPYLVPEAKQLLDEIGESFNRKVKAKYGNDANKIKVTSLLRTPYSQKRLRRVNKNAVDSSTHLMGTTFDLAYNIFHITDSTKAINGGELKKILAEVLLEKRLEEKCFIKYEIKSPCFHITVNK